MQHFLSYFLYSTDPHDADLKWKLKIFTFQFPKVNLMWWSKGQTESAITVK